MRDAFLSFCHPMKDWQLIALKSGPVKLPGYVKDDSIDLAPWNGGDEGIIIGLQTFFLRQLD